LYFFNHSLTPLRFDPLVPLDLLMSNETVFLEYFLSYLRLVEAQPASLGRSLSMYTALSSQNVAASLRQCMTSLTETLERLSAGGVFPYNVTPLLKRLRAALRVVV
jgi:hypothetical protein